MQYKKVGRTGLKVSEITLGTMIFGKQVDEADAIKIMDLAFDKGITSFDTANGYTGGRSEEIVGKALKNKRTKVVLASKVASRQGPGPERLRSLPRTYISGDRSEPETIRHRLSGHLLRPCSGLYDAD